MAKGRHAVLLPTIHQCFIKTHNKDREWESNSFWLPTSFAFILSTEIISEKGLIFLNLGCIESRSIFC